MSDLVRILGQSQPRVSRHLRLLVEAGLLERHQEGSWAWYRLSERGPGAELGAAIADLFPADDPVMSLDLDRLEDVKEERARRAEEYFRQNAAEWDHIRSLHVDQGKVDASLAAILGERPVHALLDIGTGTGSVLRIAGRYADAAVGVDLSREMLAIARASLDKADMRNCQVRLADMYALPFPAGSFDAVTLHMVLHFAEDPARVLTEAARVLEPGGRLIVIDFAPHSMTDLLEQHAHRWAGFADAEMDRLLSEAGLQPSAPIHLEGAPLTVCLWQAARPADRASRSV